MTLYITPDNKLHDDADGYAKTLPSWPRDAREATEEEINAIQNPPVVPKTNSQLLAETDTWMSRISEDTVVALIQSGTVTKDKYAPIVIERINYRRQLRGQPPI